MTAVITTEQKLKNAGKDIFCGIMGGVSQTLVGHPLDTVKVRLQTTKLYSGMFDCIGKIFKEEGAAGFYKGVGSPLAGISFMCACKFFYYGQIRAYLAGKSDPKPEDLTVKQYFIAGALTGFLNSFIDSPVDLFKSKMQSQINNKQGQGYRNVIHCATDIWNKYGIRGVYQGLGITFFRDIGGNCFYFGVYEYLKRQLTEEGQSVSKLPAHKLLLAGGCAGICYWLSIYPIDVIKTSMQIDASDKSQRKYLNMVDCARKLYAEGGARRFFVGFGPCIIRSFPANGATLYAYEATKRLINEL